MNKKINILFVLTKLSSGGAQIQLFNFIKKLPPNIKSFIITIKNEGQLAEEFRKSGIPVYSLNYSRKISFSGFIYLLRLIGILSINIVFTVGYGDSLFWGRLAAILMRVKYIYSSLHTFPELGGDFSFFNKLLNGFNTRFLPVSEKMRNNLIDKHKIPAQKITTLHNGVQVRDVKDIACLLTNLSINALISDLRNKVLIIQVGKLIYYKNQLLTLEIAKKLIKKDKITNIKFLIIGEGPDKKKITNYINQHSLNGSIILAGYLSHEECLYLISKADILVLPSLSEAFPNILVESALLKKPVISADVGGTDEIVIQNKTGFLFKPDDKDAYHLHLKKLVSSNKIRKNFGDNGYQYVSKNFSLDLKVKRFLQLLSADVGED